MHAGTGTRPTPRNHGETNPRLSRWLLRSWESRGAASTALLPLSWLYGAVVATRAAWFRAGLQTSTRLPVPVIVVGNLVTGGAGKTPAVIAIVELLRRHGVVPGIVSRGYGRQGDSVIEVNAAASAVEVGDEPLLLHRRTGAPVFVGRDRSAAAAALLAAHPTVTALVSDDGLQHLTLQRDIEVVVFDERGPGNGRLLPAGPLRGRMPSTPARGRLVLYNAARPTTDLAGYVSSRRLAGAIDLEGWWRGDAASPELLASLRGRPVTAVAGLARPERFFAMLREAGVDGATLALPDHATFDALPWSTADRDVVLTEKDAVKLRPGRELGVRVWVAALDFVPETAFETALLQSLASARSKVTSEADPSI